MAYNFLLLISLHIYKIYENYEWSVKASTLLTFFKKGGTHSIRIQINLNDCWLVLLICFKPLKFVSI